MRRAGGRTSTPTSWPRSRPGCGRRTTGASRLGCSALLVDALRAQARVSWPRALGASLLLTRAAAGFARATGDYERFAPDIGRAYRMLGLPDHVDAEAVARHELRWWVVRREIGLAAGTRPANRSPTCTPTLYDVPRERVAEAGRLRGVAAEVRDRGATDDPDGPRGAGAAYWPEVARLLRASYRSLKAGISSPAEPVDGADGAGPLPRVAARVAAARRAGRGSLAVVRTTADEPPGGREERRGDEQLGRVPDDERRQAGGDRVAPTDMPVTAFSHGSPIA